MANTIQPNNNTSLYNSTGNAVPTTGNLDANNINASGNVTVGGYIIANGSITTASNFVGNLVGNVTGNVTGNIVLSGGNTQIIYNNNGVTGSSPAFTFNQASNVVSATGNVTANYFLGNGSQLTGLPATYGNANVEALLPVYTGDFAGANINLTGYASATGNITGNYILGNGSQLTGITANYSNANVQAFLPTYSGNLNPNFVSATGNVTATFLKTSGAQGNITGANYVSANFYLGDGGLLSNISSPYGNAQVATFLSAFGSNTVSTTGTVTAGNITGGNIATGGTVSATGNITGNYLIGDGSLITNLPGGSYGNANVATFMANFGSNTIVTTGNITAGNINGLVAAGNIVGTVANATFATSAGTANTATSATTAGTVTSNAQANITSVGTLANLDVTGNITSATVSTTGNITGNYILGNGSQLTGLPAGYSNADVNSHLASFGSNTISTTGNITAGYFVGNGSLLSNITGANVTGTVALATQANVANTANAVAGANVTGSVAQANYANIANSVSGSNVSGSVAQATVADTANAVAGGNVSGQVANALVAGTVYTNAQPNITSVGTLSSLSVTGNIATGGILTDNYYYANGTPFSGGGGTYGNANVADFLAAFGSNTVSTTGTVTAGNITGGNILTGGVISASGNITAANLGNVSELSLNGNSSQVLYGNGVFAAVTGGGGSPGGSPFQFQYNNSGNFGGIPNTNYYSGNGIIEMALTKFEVSGASGIVTVPGSAGYVSVTGNVIAGNVFTGGTVSATGNITGNYILGNGSQLTGITASAGGSNTQLQFNNANALAGNAAMTFNTSTGNITLGNIIVELDQQIQTVSAYSGNTSGRNAGQITVGDGLAGNITDTTYLTSSARGARLLTYDGYVKVDNGQRNTQLAALSYANLNGSTTFGTANSNSRIAGFSSEVSVINGNTVATSPNLIRGTQVNVYAGSGANTGNANIASLSAVYSFVQTYAGSRIGNAWSYTADSAAAGTTGPLDTFIGFSSAPSHTANVTTGNVFGVYQANNTATYGRATANIARQANQYYFLRNDDDLARSRLGMLDRFHELNANTANTTGTVDIDKNSGQVQTIYPTGNITIGTLSNFVTRVTKPDSTFVNAADTVTVIIQQGATPYTVTMPTGNANIRYATGVSTVASTANTTTMLSITGTYNYQTSANQYLITISPEFS